MPTFNQGDRVFVTDKPDRKGRVVEKRQTVNPNDTSMVRLDLEPWQGVIIKKLDTELTAES